MSPAPAELPAISIRCVARCRSRGKQGHRRGLVLGTIDGHSIKIAANRPPDCTCRTFGCSHIKTLRSLIDPDLLQSRDNCRQ